MGADASGIGYQELADYSRHARFDDCTGCHPQIAADQGMDEPPVWAVWLRYFNIKIVEYNLRGFTLTIRLARLGSPTQALDNPTSSRY
jgi:hypothetical protein